MLGDCSTGRLTMRVKKIYEQRVDIAFSVRVRDQDKNDQG